MIKTKEQTEKDYLEEIKTILEKKSGKEVSWQEAKDALYSLKQLASISYDIWQLEEQRKRKLAASPKEFKLSDGSRCSICGALGEWYDEWGVKCLICQEAINQEIIPPSVAKDKDAWYSGHDMHSCFGLKSPELRKLIKAQLLNARTIMKDAKHIYFRLFLIEENKDILPPKKLVESVMITEVVDDKQCFSFIPWYHFVNPYKHLQGYKIMDYLRLSDD